MPLCAPLTEEGSPTGSIDRSPINDDDDAAADTTTENAPPTEEDDFPEDTQGSTSDAFGDGEMGEDDGFGDFDDFEEGGEGDDDFGDFDDGFQQGEEQAESTFDSPQIQTPVPAQPQPPPGPVSAAQLAQACPTFQWKRVAVMSELTWIDTACTRFRRPHLIGRHY